MILSFAATVIILASVSLISFKLWLCTHQRHQEINETEDVYRREKELQKKMEEERARNIVIFGGYRHWDGHWQDMDIGEFAMRSPYKSVRDKFRRQYNRGRPESEQILLDD